MKRKKPAAELVNCPICGRATPLLRINSHLERECRGAPAEPCSAPSVSRNASPGTQSELVVTSTSLSAKPAVKIYCHFDGETVQWGMHNQGQQAGLMKLRGETALLVFTCSAKTGLHFGTPRVQYGLTPSVMKSALQKCVRLSLAHQAVAIAKAIICTEGLGIVELCRRVAVIAIEDAILHPDLGFLLWSTVALSKGFTCTVAMVNRVLNLVYDIAACTVKDNSLYLEEDGPDSLISELLYTVAGVNHQDRVAEETTLLSSMILRAALGGMAGDKIMMLNAALLWKDRFARPEAHALPESSAKTWTGYLSTVFASHDPIEFNEVPLLNISDIPLSAVDFHCSPIVRLLVFLPKPSVD